MSSKALVGQEGSKTMTATVTSEEQRLEDNSIGGWMVGSKGVVKKEW